MPDQDYDTDTDTAATDTINGESTSPYLPTFSTDGFEPLANRYQPLVAEPEPRLTLDTTSLEDLEREPTAEPMAVPARPVVLPGSYQFVKRWVFALIVAGVWAVAAAIGVGLFQWWFTDTDPVKQWPVFGVLVYVVATTVGGCLAAMVQNRPRIAALAIAVMSAPVASTAAAAVLYGAYAFGWIAR
jgi:hypothetical protein